MKPKNRHPSDSTEQVQAQKEILQLINQECNLDLTSKKILIDETLFQVDGFSEDPPILCEIYARIGKMKVAQHNKIAKDILKMLLIEKMKDQQFRKIIAFADEEAAHPFLDSESWYSKLKDNFNVEIFIVQIADELRYNLIQAQKRQYR